MIKKFYNFSKLNEEDDYEDVVHDEDEIETERFYKYNIDNSDKFKINKLIDYCLHNYDKSIVSEYINEYINYSPIIKSKNGYGFFGIDTNT